MKTLFDKDLTLEEAQELIKNGADVNGKDDLGLTPLFYANNIDLIQLLIDNGADVNKKLRGENLSIFNHTQLDDINIVKLLIHHGVNIHIIREFNDNLLHVVENVEVAKLLMTYNIAILTDKEGDTPLHTPKENELVKLLIDYGVDVNSRNKFGETPLFCYFIDQPQSKTLIEHGAVPVKISHYQEILSLLTKEQQKAFNTFMTIAPSDEDFFQMCLAYQEGIKNNISMDIKDIAF